MRGRRFTLILFMLMTMLVLISCGSDGSKRVTGGKLRVVATTNIVGDAVRSIAGDHVELSSLMGAGVDPHLFRATKGDISRLSNADVIFYSGLHLEAKLTDILEKMSRNKVVAALATAIPDSAIRYVDSVSSTPDPHIWFDVALWSHAITQITKTLSAVDTANRLDYERRTQILLDSMAALHQWIKKEVATISEERRVLVTAHDAFEYFGRAYNIDVRGLQGISTVTEAGLYDITHMIDTIVARKIKAVFVETSVSRKSIEVVVEGCRARDHNIAIGGQLYSDAMGTAGTPEGTYIGMVRYNVNTIVKALK